MSFLLFLSPPPSFSPLPSPLPPLSLSLSPLSLSFLPFSLPSSDACAAVNGSEYCSFRGDCYELAATNEKVCVCKDNHFGRICQFVGPDPCLSSNPQNQCFSHGTCFHPETPTQRNYNCKCFPGFASIVFCLNPDHSIVPVRCAPDTNTNPCQNGGTCDNDFTVPRHYVCDCPAGMQVGSSSALVCVCVCTPVAVC